MPRTTVLHGVGQGFLRDPEKSQLDVALEPAVGLGCLDGGPDTGLLLEALGVGMQRRHQAEILQFGGTQVLHPAADRVDGLIDDRRHRIETRSR